MADQEDHYWDLFKREVDRGRRGDAVWIPVSMPKLSNHTGITKRFYVLVGGDPGTGKSAFVHLNYVLHPYYWWKKMKQKGETDIKLRIILRSMERSKHYTIGKWVCWMLWHKYDILMDVPTMYGWGSSKKNVTDEVYEKIKETRDWFYEMEDVVTIIDGADNPTGIYKQMRGYARKHGNEYKKNQYEKAYDPNDEKRLTVFVLDHIGCLKSERGFNAKQNLDKMSEYLKELRDLYGITNVVVNQFNRSLSDSSRRRHITMAPEKQDFKGSGNMYEDADVAVGLFNPHEYHINDNLGFPVQHFVNDEGYNRFRSLYVLKNTYGIDNFAMGMNFIGEIGHFRQLPSPDSLTSDIVRKSCNAEPF